MDDPEYAPIPDDRYDEFRSVVRYAFSPEDGPAFEREEDRAPLGEARGLLTGDDLRSVCRHHHFRAFVRGEWRDLGGLSAVATPPEFRRRGYVGRLVEESLAEYRERDWFLSALWPFSHPFYRQYGWATGAEYHTYECDPSVLGVATPEGEVRRVTADDWEALDPVHRSRADRWALTIERTERWWRERVFDDWSSAPYVYAYERDGEVRGYLVYAIDEEGDGRVMELSDYAYTDREAFSALCRFCADHDSQVSRVRLRGPTDLGLHALVSDPADVHCERSAGAMVRLVDVETALAALASPTAGSVVFEVTDTTAPWNDGRFELAVEGTSATCHESEADPDVRCDVGTLSQLSVGFRSVADAERLGTFAVGDDRTRSLLADWFPAERVSLSDGF